MAKGSFRSLSFKQGIGPESEQLDRFSTVNRPKLKFNFTVTFKFRRPVNFPRLNPEATDMADEMTFALKQASRPNPTINYQDVNFYNYRTKVATKVEYGVVQLTLYDDVENFAHDMYEEYLKHVSPIANVKKEEANTLFSSKKGPQNKTFNSEGIIDGDGSDDKIDAGTGSIGPLPEVDGGESGLIENIIIRHWYFAQTGHRGNEEIDPDATAPYDVENIQFIEYQFLNPKIINMTLDELDMTQSDVNTLLLNFNYDSVYINSPRSFKSTDNVRATARLGGSDFDTFTASGMKEQKTDGDTFTLQDIRARITDTQRLIRRIRRLDTLPDISILETAGVFTPPISGNLPNIQLPKPDVELPPVLDTF